MGCRTEGLYNRKDAGVERRRKGGMRDRMDACRRGKMGELSEAGLADAGQEESKKGGKQDR